MFRTHNARCRCVAGAFLLLVGLPRAAAAQDTRVLTLDQVVRLALERDPAAVAAEAAISNASADLLQAKGSWLPNVFINSTYANSSNERFDQSSGQLVSQSYSAQLQGGYDIFAGGRRLLNHRAANASLDAADAQYASQ